MTAGAQQAPSPDVGALYLVGTPIGNLEDITLRALRVLGEVDLVAAEDTRITRKLLAHYQIRVPVTSYHRHNLARRTSELVAQLKQGKQIALVSDAGMPGISDPGEELVRASAAVGIPVIPVPGPTAAITALAVSGLPTAEFVFVGFLPRAIKKRRELLASLATQTRTTICHEAPHRLLAALRDFYTAFGSAEIAVARELTKAFEEVRRGTASQLLEHFSAVPPKGEMTLVIAPTSASPVADCQAAGDLRAAVKEARRMIAEGVRKTEAAKQVAVQYRVSRAALYRQLST